VKVQMNMLHFSSVAGWRPFIVVGMCGPIGECGPPYKAPCASAWLILTTLDRSFPAPQCQSHFGLSQCGEGMSENALWPNSAYCFTATAKVRKGLPSASVPLLFVVRVFPSLE
jgi:hypothetical protein